MATSKPLPSALQSFVHGTPFESHRDYAPSSSSSSQQHPSFRTQPQLSGSDEDFGRFAAPSASSSRLQAPTPSLEPSFSSQAADGGDVQDFLRSGGMTEELEGDWEAALFSDQLTPWKAEQANLVPLDPLPSSSALTKGKGRPGSPTESPELLSSLSSLDLSSRTYLSSLAALPPEESIADYLSQHRYTDDIYGLPEGVRKLLERAEKGKEGEEGHTKAVKRLEMVLRHFRGGEDSLEPSEAPVEKRGRNDEWDQDNAARSSQPARETTPWASEYAVAAQHIGRSNYRGRERGMVGTEQDEAIGRNQEEALARTAGVQRAGEDRVEGLGRGVGGGVRDRDGREVVGREEVERRREGEKEERREEAGEEGLPPFQEFMKMRLKEMARSSSY